MSPELELVQVGGKRGMWKPLLVIYLVIAVYVIVSKFMETNEERQRQAAFLASRMNKLTDDSYAVRVMVEHLTEAQRVKSDG